MNISVNNIGIKNTNGAAPAASAQVEEDGLFVGETNSTTPVSQTDKTSKDKALLEAELVKYEAELKALEAEKAVKQADKKELEAQKRTLDAKKEKLQAEIDSNNKLIAQYTKQMTEFSAETQKEEESIQNLQKQYDAKNKEAQEITEKLNEKIAQVIENSNNNVKSSREKIQQATEEAYAKVASGEIEESEVAQYISQKAGCTVNSDSAASFSEINSLSGQVKALISGASSILTAIGAKQTNVNKIKAQMVSGSVAINELNSKNATKGQELSSVNKEITAVGKEISSITTDIAKVDVKIVKVQANITETKSAIATLNGEKVETKDENVVIINPTEPKEETIITSDDSANVNVGASQNPFVAISFETVNYTNVVDALDAISRNNDTAIQNARTQDDNNKQEVRNLFQDLLKA